MEREEALRLVSMLGNDLERHPRGNAYSKALLMVIGLSEDGHGMQDVHGALGLHPDVLEAAYEDCRALVYQEAGRDGADAARRAREGLV